MASSNPYFFVEILPTLLQFFSKNPPENFLFDGKKKKSQKDHLVEQQASELELVAVDIIESIHLHFVQRKRQIRGQIREQVILDHIRKSWPALCLWLSFLIDSLIKPELDVFHALWSEIPLKALFAISKILVRVLNLNSGLIHCARELFSRIILCCLFVDVSSAESVSTMTVVGSLVPAIYDDDQRAVLAKFVKGLDPSRVHDIARTLCDLVQQPELDYNLIISWMACLCLVSFDSPRLISVHSGLHFITYLLRRISKNLSRLVRAQARGAGSLLEDAAIFKAVEIIMSHLYDMLSAELHIRVIRALEDGLLETFWELTQLSKKIPQLGFYKESLHRVLSAVFVYCSSHYYVLKELERRFQKRPLNEITEETEWPWGSVMKGLRRRFKARREWEGLMRGVDESFLCSNPMCPGTSGQAFRCVGCNVKFYCSRRCQKSHWPEHRCYCLASAKAQKEGTIRPLDDRCRLAADYILDVDHWSLRPQLLEEQAHYRESKGLSPDSFLISIVYDSSSLDRREVWTLEEAKEKHSELDWDRSFAAFVTYRRFFGEDAGPAIGLESTCFRPIVITKPGIFFDYVDEHNILFAMEKRGFKKDVSRLDDKDGLAREKEEKKKMHKKMKRIKRKEALANARETAEVEARVKAEAEAARRAEEQEKTRALLRARAQRKLTYKQQEKAKKRKAKEVAALVEQSDEVSEKMEMVEDEEEQQIAEKEIEDIEKEANHEAQDEPGASFESSSSSDGEDDTDDEVEWHRLVVRWLATREFTGQGRIMDFETRQMVESKPGVIIMAELSQRFNPHLERI
ncbi:hypothetical protein GYMLUDRAFT_265334 [Collybiopsis luxurians FD-317 M1]|uniref:MYND-type domain-containing protein n=1 Tax=Collybiopsis luxurians FD-317 M1 TaxID=944289 RepID=A0A0D0AQW5_9AGAR|nr:hypothetical protein GYMLUDRAFT_265334 [Collybiopsis luxurians FD-317 M1]